MKMNLTGLMPRPFSKFHSQYLSRYREGRAYGRPSALNIVGNPLGIIVPALHRNGTVFWCRLDVHEIPDDSGRLTFTGKLTIETAAGSPEDTRAFILRLHAPYRGAADSLSGTASGVTVVAASETVEHLAGVRPEDLQDMPLGKVLQMHNGKPETELADVLRRLCGPEDEMMWDACPYVPAQLLRPDGTAVDVALGRLRAEDAYRPEEPTTLQVQVWVLQRVEGIVEITADGTITSSSMGVSVTLGYHDDVRNMQCGGP